MFGGAQKSRPKTGKTTTNRGKLTAKTEGETTMSVT
jgi:hypothetical protein